MINRSTKSVSLQRSREVVKSFTLTPVAAPARWSIEEALRRESPVQGLFRVAKAESEIGGVKIPERARLVVMYASGNRDEAEFPDADRFDVRRVNARMHLGFGQGEHFCIGGALARLEARVAFEILLTRMQNIRLAAGKNDFAHMPSFILRGLKELHLEFEAS